MHTVGYKARNCGLDGRFIGIVIAAALLVAPFPAAADWINLTGAEIAPNIAEIYVDDDGVRVALEIHVANLAAFTDVVPTDWYRAHVAGSAPGSLPPVVEGGLTVRDGDGTLLPMEITLAEPRLRIDRRSPFAGMINPLTGIRAPEAPADKRVLYAELFYPFPDELPDQITLSPPMDDNGIPIASIGMLVHHREIPVIDFRYFSGPATLTLNWDDPWYSRFDNPNLIRHHRYPRMSFLYAEPYEIRHEALLRVRDAAELVELELTGPVLTPEEAEQLTDAAAEAVGKRSPITIDGKAVIPDFDRAAFMRIGASGLEILNEGDPVNVDAGILGLIYSAATDGYAKEATVEWTLFDDRASQVPGNAIDAAGPFLFNLTPENPVLVWTNHFTRPAIPPVTEVDAREWAELQLPILSSTIWIGVIGLFLLAGRRGRLALRIGSGTLAAVMLVGGVFALPYGTWGVARPWAFPVAMSEDEAITLTGQLLTNIYRSFDFRGEAQVYDRLALTVDGSLLEQVFLDQRRSLRVARAGGAEARVMSVNVESATPESIEGTASDFRVRTRWTIVGNVGHWGHVHQRHNLYEADLTVSATSGTWKITDFDVLVQERLSL